MPVPESVNLCLSDEYISIPIPRDWNLLLKEDKSKNYKLANTWREVTRTVIQHYHNLGYTTIGQVGDKENDMNLQFMVKDFDPFNPPQELLIN